MAVASSIGDEFPGPYKYNSLAVASNGRLYAAPCNASRVLEIDPADGATRLIGDELPGDDKSRKTACGIRLIASRVERLK